MKLPFIVVAAVTFVGGGALLGAATITELGSVASESSDRAQTARVAGGVPAWTAFAKPLGLTLMAASLVATGVLLWRRR